MPPTATPLTPPDPAGLVLVPDGMAEIRPCPGCRARLAVPEPDLGREYACPGCGTGFRALAAWGPFTRTPLSPDQPTVPLARPTTRPPDDDPLPVPVAVERSAVVTSAGWATGLVGLALIGWCTWYAARSILEEQHADPPSEAEVRLEFGLGCGCPAVAAVCYLAGGVGIHRRRVWGLLFTLLAVGLSATCTTGMMAARVTAHPAYFLFALHAAYVTGVLVIPRHLAEFGIRLGRQGAGRA